MVAQTRTRYLIVTHNAVSMARMHRLFGVTMVERGVSRLVSVNLHGAEALLAAQ
jgi:chromosome segregation protein